MAGHDTPPKAPRRWQGQLARKRGEEFYSWDCFFLNIIYIYIYINKYIYIYIVYGFFLNIYLLLGFFGIYIYSWDFLEYIFSLGIFSGIYI